MRSTVVVSRDGKKLQLITGWNQSPFHKFQTKAGDIACDRRSSDLCASGKPTAFDNSDSE